MRKYLEITLLHNPDIIFFDLWSKLFQQIHLALVEMQNNQKEVPIGISFPEYYVDENSYILGNKCRLFASDKDLLESLNIAIWFNRLIDYIHITSIRSVPENLDGYATYCRVQPKNNSERLARRYAKRHGLDFEMAWGSTITLNSVDADLSYPTKFSYRERVSTPLALPFIRLQSLSNGQSFRLWIAKNRVATPVAGCFNCYGLSRMTTVPEF